MFNNNYEEGLVSVIIPTYKRSDMLARTINSVLRQSYKKIEVLVVDDNEPNDNYSNQVKTIISNYDDTRVKLVMQPRHINGAVARNNGIKIAKGEYIAFLDDDDLWMPNKIEKQVNELKRLDTSYGGVSTRKAYIYNGNVTHISGKYTEDQQCERIMSNMINISTCTILLRHLYLDEVGYFDESLERHQEVQLFSFFSNKYKIKLLDEILTIIDCSDVSNRPSAERLIKYKSDFFKSIEPLLSNYPKRKQKYIKNIHMCEVAWVYYREGNKTKGIKMLSSLIINPLILFMFVKRYINKKQEISLAKKHVGANDISNYVMKCNQNL